MTANPNKVDAANKLANALDSLKHRNRIWAHTVRIAGNRISQRTHV